MEQKFCQSCGMPLSVEMSGINRDCREMLIIS